MNKTRLFAAVFAFGIIFSVTTESADAGRFGIFRRGTPQRTYQQARTTWAPRTVFVRPKTSARTTSNRTTGRTEWPGAIGAPSYRYQAFQDTFGYWD